MRKWWILVAILVVLVGAFLLAALNLGRWLTDNRDWVAEQARSALGREVAFQEIGISFRGGLGLRLTDLRIGEDPAFGKEDFLRAGVLDVGVKLLPALRGRIEVSRVVLRSPAINVTRTAQGLSTASLGKTAGGAGGGSAGGEQAGGEGASPALLVALVDIRDGKLRFVDRTVKPPAELVVEQIDLHASDISLDEPVDFELSAAVLGAKQPNLEASGSLGPIGGGSPEDAHMDLDWTLAPLDLGPALRLPGVAAALPEGLQAEGTVSIEAHAEGTQARAALNGGIDARDAHLRMGDGFDKARGVPFELRYEGTLSGDTLDLPKLQLAVADTTLRGKVEVKSLEKRQVAFDIGTPSFALRSFGLSESGDEVLRDLSLRGNLSVPAAGPQIDAELRSPSGMVAAAPYENLSVDFGLKNQRATLKKLSLAAFGGTLAGSGVYDLGGASHPFDLQGKLAGMRMEKLVASRSPAGGVFVEGQLDANLDVRGSGAGWDQIKRAMTGKGNLVMKDGKLKNVNLADEVLQGVTGVPGLSNLLSPKLRSKYPRVFGGDDTPFETMDAKFDIGGGFVDARDLNLVAPDWALEGRGRMSLDGDLDANTVMRFSEALSTDLVGQVKQAKYLRGADGRVSIPVRLKGHVSKIRPQPDLAGLVSGAQRELVGGLIEKALGADKNKQGQTPAPEAPTGETAPPPDPTQQLIERGLQEIFKKKN